MNPVKSLINKLKKKPKPNRKPLVLIPIGLVVILSSGVLVFSTNVLTPSAETLLPSSRLLAFSKLEKPDCSTFMAESLRSLCIKRAELITSLTTANPQRIETFANKVAMAFYNSPSGSSPAPETVVMFRVHNKGEAERFLDYRLQQFGGEEQYFGSTKALVFDQPKTHVVFFWSGWLVFADSGEVVNSMQSVKDDLAPSLAQDTEYLKSTDEFNDAQAIVYLPQDAILQLFSPNQRGVLKPALELYKSFTVGYSEQNNRAIVEVLARTDLSQLSPEQTNTDSTIADDIALFPSENLAVLAAADSMTEQIEKVLQEIEKTDPAFAIFLRGRARALLAEFAGDSISLDMDILPLLSEEAVVAMYNYPDSSRTSFAAFAKHADGEFVRAKYESLVESLTQKSAEFVPQILTHRLDDGTEIKEIVACDDCVQVTQSATGGVERTTIKVGDFDGEMYEIQVAKYENNLVASNSQEVFDAVLAALAANIDVSVTELTAQMPKGRIDEVLIIDPQNVTGFIPNTLRGIVADFALMYITSELTEQGMLYRLEGAIGS
jgi:hypothetical protein